MGWISSAIGAVSGILGATQARNSAQAQYNAQLGLMGQQYAYNKEMFQNRHQWEVEDLRKAGLNPILSANSGASAASVSGGSVSESGAGSEISKGLSSAAQYNLTSKQLDIEQKNADTAYMNAQSQKLTAEAAWRNSGTQERLGSSSIQLNDAEIKYKGVMAEVAQKEYVLHESMNRQNIKESDQRIANSILELNGKLALMRAQGEAALTSASAAALTADVFRQNGVSLRDLQSAEWKKIQSELERIDIHNDVARFQNPAATGNWNESTFAQKVGEFFRVINPFTNAVTGAGSLLK